MNAKLLFQWLIVLILTLGTAHAATFSVSPSSVNEGSVDLSTAKENTFTVTNNGNSTLNLSISKNNLNSGSNIIALSLNDTSLSIPAGSSKNFKVSYSTGTDEETFTGNVTLTDNSNSSNAIVIPYTVTVQDPSGAKLEIINEPNNDKIIFRTDITDDIDDSFRLKNTGNVDLTNLKIELKGDLNGKDGNERIDESDIDLEFDRDDNDEQSRLTPTNTIRVEVDINIDRSELELDTYEGEFEIRTDQRTFIFGLEVEIRGGNEEITIRYLGGDRIEVREKAGERIDDIEFIVDNTGDFDLNDLEIVVRDPLKGQNGKTFPTSAISFRPNSLDLKDGEDDEVELIVNIPDNQAPGTYNGEISVLDSNGDELEDIGLEIKVVGDVFIDTSSYEGLNKEYKPGDIVTIRFDVVNDGTQLYRNVKVTGKLENIDASDSEVSDTTSTFAMDVGDRSTKTLRFTLPDDTRSGEITLVITLDFDDQQDEEIEKIKVVRPEHKVMIESFSSTPSNPKCDDQLFSYIKVKNVGENEETVKFTVEVEGTGSIQSGIHEIGVDEIEQESFILDIKNIEPGNYNVLYTISYTGETVTRESILKVQECKDSTVGGIDVKPEKPSTGDNTDSSDSVSIFGGNFDKTTVLLGTGLGIVAILIIVSLFFI